MKKYMVFILLVLVSTACSLSPGVASQPVIVDDGSEIESAAGLTTTGTEIEEQSSRSIESAEEVVSSINLPTIAESMPTSDAEALQYMLEEEKLAHDVYQYLYEKWGQRIFTNVASSESRHMEAVRKLVASYGLDDTSLSTGPGEFTIPELQQLYDQLVVQGSQSLVDALNVGVTIEEVDIQDLERYMATTSDSAILRVFDSLLQGSRNHLSAFTRSLEQKTGQTIAGGSSNSGQFQGQESGNASSQGKGRRQGWGQ